VMLAVGSVVAWAALWIAAERRVPGGQLLDLQAAAGLFGVGLIAIVAAAQLFVHPDRGLDPAFAEFGLVGGPLLAAAAWACFNRATPHDPELRAHVVGFAGMIAGVIAAMLLWFVAMVLATRRFVPAGRRLGVLGWSALIVVASPVLVAALVTLVGSPSLPRGAVILTALLAMVLAPVGFVAARVPVADPPASAVGGSMAG